MENQKEFLQAVARVLNIKQYRDWGKITLKQVIDAGGRAVLKQYKYSLQRALQTIYPGNFVAFSQTYFRDRMEKRVVCIHSKKRK